MTEPVIIGNATLYQGDCLDILRTLPDASVDAVVTDPPYALSFMGRDWDKGFPDPAIWAECLRVLKPGGHMLAFGGTRTHHRLWCQIEDAGFYIVDNIAWVYGSGFPKGKAQLKPAHEPICLAVKKGKRWLNVDGCRVPLTETEPRVDEAPCKSSDGSTVCHGGGWKEREKRVKQVQSKQARWPANLIHDGSDEVLEVFAGTEKLNRPGDRASATNYKQSGYEGGWRGHCVTVRYDADRGSAARFFYCAKASKRDRNDGCEGMPLGEAPASARSKPAEGRQNALGAPRHNSHPTVKPTMLMRYLCRLITPPDGIVLDPFMGSGSTGKAAMREGFRFIGIEREPRYFDIACERIENAQRQQALDLEPAA